MPISDHHDAAMQAGGERAERLLSPQAELLGLGDMAEPERVRAMAERRAKAGRPPGARNKRSEDVARFVVETFGDPLVRQAAVATMSLPELAAYLGCSLVEAAQEQRLAAVAVLPYLHRKMPQQIDLTHHRTVSLTIVEGHALGGEQLLDMSAVTVVENQTLSIEGSDDV